jgi:para-aminobenzoate synthetase/4-amino-4-deoxychorismate lyase
MDREQYLDAIARIKQYIATGDTYQVNLTLKLLFDYCGEIDALYRTLRHNQRVAFSAWVRGFGRDVLSFSPELFFRAEPGRIRVRPMKGTAARGRTLQEDAAHGRALQNDVKTIAENVMIVDLLRNDLGRLLYGCSQGRVVPGELFTIEPYETLLQMTSTIDATFNEDQKTLSLARLIPALFPCGSVTGAPKIRTMEIIRELEQGPRGVYCGAIGFAGPKEIVFNVPIRTLVLEDGRGEMGIGSGIVHDSSPEKEWEECLLKGNFLTRPRKRFQLIETLLWQLKNGYWLLAEHLERLADSAAFFGYPCTSNGVRRLLEEAAASFDDKAMRVRLLLFDDGRISIEKSELAGNCGVEMNPTSNTPVAGKALLSPQRVDRRAVHLYHKTTNRRLYDEELKRVREKGYIESFFQNERGELTEGCISNLFLLQGETLFTPPVTCGLLNGTLRRHLLRTRPDRVQEKVLGRGDLQEAEGLFMGNSLRGLVRLELEVID